MDYREQAIKDVAECSDDYTPRHIRMLIDGIKCEADPHIAYAVSQREARLRLREALAFAVSSYENSNRELLNMGLLPEGKQPLYVLKARAALSAEKDG